MTSKYKVFFDNFLGLIEDYEFASLDRNNANELMVEYLHKAFAKPYVRRLFQSLTLDDSIQTVTFTMLDETDSDVDLNFTVEVVAYGMVIEWLRPLVRSKLNIRQNFSNNKESKFYSQSSHLNELQSLLNNTINDQRSLIADRGYIYNPYLNNI